MSVVRIPPIEITPRDIGVEPIRTHKGPTGLHYLAYVPRGGDTNLEPLVFVHGYGRRVHEQLKHLKALADDTGRPLLAPFFSKTQHLRYQRLGKGSDGLRADHYFNAGLEDAASRYGLSADRFVLIGYSGGGQFAHRYTMIYPQRVSRLIAISSGWYTFPDREMAYPYGLETARKLRRVSMNPEAFLKVPMSVLVGAQDFETKNLRSNPELDKQQGMSRVERARRWVLSMRMAARLYRVDADISYQEVPGIGHSFSQFVTRGYLRELIIAAINEGTREDLDAVSRCAAETGAGYGA
ncbi:MAG: alpha/beta fold hydrolase [Pseudomonadota bacterium]